MANSVGDGDTPNSGAGLPANSVVDGDGVGVVSVVGVVVVVAVWPLPNSVATPFGSSTADGLRLTGAAGAIMLEEEG